MTVYNKSKDIRAKKAAGAPSGASVTVAEQRKVRYYTMAIFGANEYFNVSMGEGRPPKHIRGVSCDVKNCVYHDGDSFCTADRITVGPGHAKHSADTACATFREKNL